MFRSGAVFLLFVSIIIFQGCGSEEIVVPYQPGAGDGSSVNDDASLLYEPKVTVVIEYPNGGDTLSYKEHVTWEATHSDPDWVMSGLLRMSFHYSNDGGDTWVLIAEDEDNDNLYVWDVRGIPPGDDYRLRITATDTLGLDGIDISDSDIRISDRIILTDWTGKKWDITHAVEVYDMQPENWNFGIGPYAIRPINYPRMLTPEDKEYPSAEDTFEVIGLNYPGAAPRAYPVFSIFFNEVVNDEVNGVPFAAVY
jgi:hypothetical protein